MCAFPKGRDCSQKVATSVVTKLLMSRSLSTCDCQILAGCVTPWLEQEWLFLPFSASDWLPQASGLSGPTQVSEQTQISGLKQVSGMSGFLVCPCLVALVCTLHKRKYR